MYILCSTRMQLHIHAKVRVCVHAYRCRYSYKHTLSHKLDTFIRTYRQMHIYSSM